MTHPQPVADAARPGWPAIEDYALLGDCRTAALVGRDGSIDWWCLPHVSGAAWFARLLDRARGGCFAVAPTGRNSVTRRYIDGSNVLRTRFRVDGGELVLTDAMVVPDGTDGLPVQRELLRCIEAIGTPIEVDVLYAPRPDFARADVPLQQRGRLGWACCHGSELLLLQSELPFAPCDAGRSLRARCVLQPGERRYLSASFVSRDIGVVAPLGEAAERRLTATVRWWQRWADNCAYDGPYRAEVLRSALVLKALTYCLSGGVIAAATASLPEDIGGVRNWDYRYCWLRDAALTMTALVDLGFTAEADAFLGWLLHSTRLTWPRLQVLYDVHGHARIDESTLDHFEGYRGSRPVHIGNAAWKQRQLDVYGSVVMAAATYAFGGGSLGRDDRRMLAGLGRSVCRCWREPDHGIWEARGEPRHHTFSKVSCWAALDCLVRLGSHGILSVSIDHFRRERDAIRASIERDGFNEACGAYTAVFGTDVPDASLLLAPRFGYCDPNHPRMAGTFDYLDRRLSHGALMYRYPPGSDGLPGGEHPFGICSFWAVEHLARAGRVDQAQARMEALLQYANEVGLYAEEIEADSGAAIGNFPQAFTHVGLINAAVSLADALGERSTRRQA